MHLPAVAAKAVENPLDPTPFLILCDYLCDYHSDEQYARDFVEWCNSGSDPTNEWLDNLLKGHIMPLSGKEPGLLRLWCQKPSGMRSPNVFTSDIEATVRSGRMRWTTRSKDELTLRGRHRKITLSTSEVCQHVYDNDGVKGIIALVMSARYFRYDRRSGSSQVTFND